MAAAYAQQNVKRQKVIRNAEVDHFSGIEKIEYKSDAGVSDTLAYRNYNPGERIQGRSMEEWMKFSVSFTHFKFIDITNFSKQHYQRTWDDNSNSLENRKRCIKALFDFCTKLNVRYWTAYDTDLIPRSDNFEEAKNFYEEITDFLLEMIQKYNVRPLWIAPDLISHHRYSSGAISNPDANTFIQACLQTKRVLEMCQKLSTECFVFIPQEYYRNFFDTDINREIKLLAKFLKITHEFKERICYRGQMLLMPCLQQEFQLKNCYKNNSFVEYSPYLWDSISCVAFLKNFSLDKYFKVYERPNHRLFITQTFGLLGGVKINEDIDIYNRNRTTALMKSILDLNNQLIGGFTLRLSPTPDFTDMKDLFNLYVNRIDALAEALRRASKINNEQLFTKRLQQNYSSYYGGFGARIMSGDFNFEEAEEYIRKNQQILSENASPARREHWNSVFHRYCEQNGSTFSCL